MDTRVHKICPRCGYKATSEQDPLLVAYEGRGQCPSCGVIVSKVNSTSRRPEDRSFSNPPPTASSGSSSRYLSLGVMVLTVILLGMAGLLIYDWIRSATGKDSAPITFGPPQSVSESDRAAAVRGSDSSEPQILIARGQSQILTLSSWLEIFHKATVAPLRIDASAEVQDNSWSERGIEVEILRQHVAPRQVEVWETKLAPADKFWMPAHESLSGLEPQQSGRELGLLSLEPEYLMSLSESSSCDFGTCRRSRYTVYPLRLDVRVSVSSRWRSDGLSSDANSSDPGTIRVGMPLIQFAWSRNAQELLKTSPEPRMETGRFESSGTAALTPRFSTTCLLLLNDNGGDGGLSVSLHPGLRTPWELAVE